MNQTPTLIEARGLVKRFGGAQALKGIEITVEAGEVHGLVGENGAGKSTLGKCIAGVVHPDEGELLVDGKAVDYRVPRDALNDGITIVEQELALVPAMSVADNILLGGRAMAGAEGSSRRAARVQVRRLNEEFSLGLDLDATVERLPVADQQKVEILRGLALGARLIVMDEPTARLARDEADNLLRIIRLIADRGTAVVFVSHFLQDVLQVSDRVTVMRNGEVVHTVEADHETPDSLVAAMLGRAASLKFPQKRPVAAGVEPILAVRNLADGRLVNNVSFTVRPGEIVGLGGLVGSGRSEVARLIFGAAKPVAGSIELDGKATRMPSVRAAVRHGIAYLPEDRKDLGLLLNLTNRENTTLAHLGEVSRFGLISRSKERRASADVLTRLGVTPPDPALRAGTLSGGNQQKVLFGKWLWRTPRLLIADEPTRGVDVGAKFAIYDLLVGLAGEGMAILLISSEIEELVGLSHRVVVMARGCTVAELREEDVQEDKVLHAAFDSVDPRLSGASA